MMSCLLRDAVNLYDLSCDVGLFGADGFYGVKSPDRRVISGAYWRGPALDLRGRETG